MTHNTKHVTAFLYSHTAIVWVFRHRTREDTFMWRVGSLWDEQRSMLGGLDRPA